MSAETTSANRQIARAAGFVMLAFIFSQGAGLLRQILVADAFGTSGTMDAFNTANRVAETLFTLVAGGALGSAFIPTFTSLLVKDRNSEAWQLASAVGNWVLLILITLSLVAAVFAPGIVRYMLAPGFSADPANEALTIHLMRIMLPSAAIFGISGLVMGILNSYQVFFIPALTPAMYQLGLIFGVVALKPRFGIDGLAWGVLLGAGAHLILQIPALLKQKGSYFPTFGVKMASTKEVLRLMLPRVFGVAVVQLNFWINIRLATAMPEGSVTGIVFAFALMLMPQAVLAQSIATAAMPTLARQFAQNKLDEVRSSLAASIRSILLLSFPASMGLILLRKPLVALIYQRGEFDAHSTELVAWALLWYAAGLVGHAVVEILARAFYALHDTKTPVVFGAAAMSLNVLLSFVFTALFKQVGWMPHGGLALANSLATALEMVVLVILMRKRLRGLGGKTILSAALASVAGSAAMGIGLWFWLVQTSLQPVWLISLGGVAIGSLVYALVMIVLRVEEMRSLGSFVLQKLRGS